MLASSSPYSIEKALDLFSLDEFTSFHEPQSDTYAIMGSSANTLVIAFRGTASSTNIMTDLKAWSMPYPPHPHLSSMDTYGTSVHSVSEKIFSAPVRVHTGFYSAWSSNNFNSTVMDAVTAAVKKMDGQDPKIFVTGHSLGGALACLAAVEIKQAVKNAKMTVYTFGSPRVGNAAFGAYSNSLISDFWQVVRTEDPVARIPKGWAYKRSGQRVILGSHGNMAVHPNYFEVSLFSHVGGKVSEHRLMNYGMGISQFIKAQYVPLLSLPGASEGLDRLSKSVDLQATLLLQGLSGNDLKDGKLLLQPIPGAEKVKIKTIHSQNSESTCPSMVDCFGCIKKQPESTHDDEATMDES